MDWKVIVSIAIGTILGRIIYDLIFNKNKDKEQDQ